MKLRVLPGQAGAGFVFENVTTGRTIPNEFVGAIRGALERTCALGVVAGYPIADVRIELYDGSYHDIESSESAFRTAAARAFENAARAAMPVLLEPVVHVEVVVPTEYAADVASDLRSRRGRIRSQVGRGASQIVRAAVPLSEMFAYTSHLSSLTLGRDVLAALRLLRTGAVRTRRSRWRSGFARRCPTQASASPRQLRHRAAGARGGRRRRGGMNR